MSFPGERQRHSMAARGVRTVIIQQVPLEYVTGTNTVELNFRSLTTKVRKIKPTRTAMKRIARFLDNNAEFILTDIKTDWPHAKMMAEEGKFGDSTHYMDTALRFIRVYGSPTLKTKVKRIVGDRVFNNGMGVLW